MAIVLIGTVLVYYRTHELSATVLEQRDAAGNAVGKSEYAKGKVVRLLESSGNLLFEIDSSAASALDNRTVPKVLREAFNSHKLPLSDELTVSVKPWKDSRWLLSDTKYEQTYSIRAIDTTVWREPSESRSQCLCLENRTSYPGSGNAERNVQR